jgi:hypothetical protein
MDTQRLRNLTTGRLHTEINHIYEDLEYITGMKGLMTHMLPNVMRAVEPWLKQRVIDPRYWEDKYDVSHLGQHDLEPMSDIENQLMLERYSALPSLL